MKKILLILAVLILLVGIAVGDGMSQNPPIISVSPEGQDFGNVMMGKSSLPQTFTITNGGGAALVVSSIELAGGDSRMFSVDLGTCAGLTPLSGGGNCTITATFSPSSGGIQATTLKIVSNDSNSPVVAVPLRGTGLQPLRVGLVLDKTAYIPGDKINVVLTLQNAGEDVIITSKGFRDKPFHLFLIFTDPDEKIVTSKLLRDTYMQDPPPPPVFAIGGNLVQVEPVEILPRDWVLSITIPNAHDYYPLLKGGSYSVKAIIPMRTYRDVEYTDTNAVPPVDYSLIDHYNSQGALESNIVNFSLSAAGPDHIKINPSSSTITAAGSQSYTATGYDLNNNSLGDVTAATAFSISPDGSCTGNTCTATAAGLHTVTGDDGGNTATASLGVYGTTAITINAPSAVYGGNGFVTVTVNSAAVTPGGNVELSVDGGPPVSQQLSSGSATFTVSTPNAGDHKLNATYATQDYFYASSGTGNLFVNAASQTITVTQQPPANAVYNTTFTVGATASSGLTVSIGASGACSISGKTITMTSGTGTCSITFDQVGSDTYNAAAQVTRSVTAQKANQTISFPALPAKTYGDADFDPGAIASSGLAVSYTSSNPAVATIVSGKIHIVGVGTSTITASQAGNANYFAAPSVDRSFQVSYKQGDLNLDGKVDCADLAIIKASAGKKCGQKGFDSRADTNSDCVVDVRDLVFVSQKVPAGTRCP